VSLGAACIAAEGSAAPACRDRGAVSCLGTLQGLKTGCCAAEGLPRADFRALHAELLGYTGYARKPVPSVAAVQLTEAAVRHSALAEPLLVAAGPAGVAELGMVLPPEPLTPDRVASQLGPNYEVRNAGGS
jgi:hypothetical protein